MVILYLLSWLLWALAVAVQRCYSTQNRTLKLNQNGQEKATISQNVQKGQEVKQNFQSKEEQELGVSSFGPQKSSINHKTNQEEKGEIDLKIDSERASYRFEGQSQRVLIDSGLFGQGKKTAKIVRKNENIEKATKRNSLKRGNIANKVQKLQRVEKWIGKMVLFSGYLKTFFFSFSFFDVQFITFNELIHSDVTLMDGLGSKGAISYLISAFTLCLMIYDLNKYFGISLTLYNKIKHKIGLGEGDKEMADFFFDDVEMRPELSYTAMNFNLISMLRFSIYQVIIASLQLAPHVQTGSLVTLQVLFFGFYVIKYKTERFFDSIFTLIRFLVFEIFVLVFLVISLIFSFEGAQDWLGSTSTALLQIIAASALLISIFVEYIVLMVKFILNAKEIVKATFCKRKPSKKRNRVYTKAEKIMINQDEGNCINSQEISKNNNKRSSMVKRGKNKDTGNDTQWNFDDMGSFGNDVNLAPDRVRGKNSLSQGSELEKLLGSPLKSQKNLLPRRGERINQEKIDEELNLDQIAKITQSAKRVKKHKISNDEGERGADLPLPQSGDFFEFLENEEGDEAVDLGRAKQRSPWNALSNQINKNPKKIEDHTSISITALNQRIQDSSKRNASAFTPRSLKKFGKFKKSKLKAQSRLKGQLAERVSTLEHLNQATKHFDERPLSKFNQKNIESSTKSLPVNQSHEDRNLTSGVEQYAHGDANYKNSRFKIGSQSRKKISQL